MNDNRSLKVDSFDVWFFGVGEHFPNSLSKSFRSEQEARDYIGRVLKELKEFYRRLNESQGEGIFVAESKLHLLQQGALSRPDLWIMYVSDTVKIVLNTIPDHVISRWKATFDTDGAFRGWTETK